MYSTIASDRELKHNTMNSCQHQTVFGLIHSQSLSKMSSASSTERGSKQGVNLSLAIEEETGSNRHEIGRGRGADCFASAQRSRTTMWISKRGMPWKICSNEAGSGRKLDCTFNIKRIIQVFVFIVTIKLILGTGRRCCGLLLKENYTTKVKRVN